MASSQSSKLAAPVAGKADAASPKLTADEVEMSNVPNGTAPPNIPLEEDIMQCARIGALELIQKMIDSGKYEATYKDPEGITPLHWAAINNQYAVCKYFLEKGAQVNARGGESNATPAMWAAQRCHYYIINLLLENGADPLLTDGQGYNIIHLATIDGNALLLILLLHQGIPVDVTDPQGHTSLMWAAYKGWPACVDLLLKWGANVNAADNNGYTPLHWGLVKGSKACMDRLLEYGADRFATTNEGKTPATCAEEMNSKRQYYKALADQGYGTDGNMKALPMGLGPILRDKSKMTKFFFAWPTVMILVGLQILCTFNIFVSVPLTIVCTFGLQLFAQWVGNRGPPDFHILIRTPFQSGIFTGTLFITGVSYVFMILPKTFRSHPFSNFYFAIAFLSTTYFFVLAMMADPGYIPKFSSRNQQRENIQELFRLWKFDEDNFCLQCMTRRPLRSKHCRRCARCVAKQDHHCPWLYNCVGNNNIRHFYIYLISLEIGLILYPRLAFFYLESLAAPSDSTCNIFSSAICFYVLRDSWTFAFTIWVVLQLIWVSMLLLVQSVQVAKNQTTYENMKSHGRGHGHGHGHNHDIGPRHPITHGASTAATSLNDSAAAATRLEPAPRRPDSCMTRWKKLLGLDVFMATASTASAGKLQDRGNPFSRGVIGNCKDFWCDPAPIFGRRTNGKGFWGGEVVDYVRMYEIPDSMRLSRRGGYTSVAREEEESVGLTGGGRADA